VQARVVAALDLSLEDTSGVNRQKIAVDRLDGRTHLAGELRVTSALVLV
jgi:hypothetical protein